MDFDEYEYLEKTVENPEDKSKETVGGGEENVKSRDKERSKSSKHRGKDDDDLDHHAKRSKTGDDSRDSDRHRERGLSRHRSRSRDRDRSEWVRDRHRSSKEHRDRERERDDKNGKGRDRDRERDRDRDRRDRDREKEEGEKDRDRNKEREHDRNRRSRSHSERHRNDRERSRDGDYKERDLRERDRESRRHKEKKEEAAEPEADPERDQRTVFAYQIALRADERDVYEFFSRAGKVRDVRLIMDRNSRRSKGVGYIEFYDVMSVPMAIALSGQPLLGQPVMVKPSEAEKNAVQSTSTAAGAAGASGSYAGGGRRLYVGNLHYNITEDQLRQVFESFGSVELVQLPLDETGHCKGFGFVQFARLEDAKAAQTLNGQLEIAGRIIKVSAVTDQTGGTQDAAKTTGELDDDEGGSLSLNAQSRALLMAKLDRSGTASSITGSLGTGIANGSGFSAASAPILGVPPVVSPLAAPLMQASVSTLGGLAGAGLSVPPVTAPSIDAIGVPSECLMLNNMFDPKLETEPDFDLDIKEDVQDECAKFGSLKHIYVDKYSTGHVYLRLDNTQAAVSAQRALNGRWFAGKMITAMFMVPQNYEAKFPESR